MINTNGEYFRRYLVKEVGLEKAKKLAEELNHEIHFSVSFIRKVNKYKPGIFTEVTKTYGGSKTQRARAIQHHGKGWI